jgi:hypothetical protein
MVAAKVCLSPCRPTCLTSARTSAARHLRLSRVSSVSYRDSSACGRLADVNPDASF